MHKQVPKVSLLATGILCIFSMQIASAQSVSPSKLKKTQYLEQRKALLTDSVKKTESQIVSLEKMKNEIASELDYLRSLQKKYQEKHDERGVSTESFAEVIKSLQAKRVDLMIDIAGLNAKRETVIDFKKDADKGSQELLDQLSQLLGIEERRYKEAEASFKNGVASGSEVQKAKARILEVRIRIAEAKQPGKSSSFLTDQLLSTSLERAEKKARLEKTESLLATFTSTRDSLYEAASNQKKLELAANKSDVAAQELVHAMNQLERQRKELALVLSELKKQKDN